ncbi:hypothetical protein BLA23254_02500 [Burkholderia lata]|uniref:Uncharacterized protein n=1 Tax=Burkholderia lata (strain ATCC 17760 / DSM 23089 / LMG 22485 / NCIMB 9086 / R18194 / 383) TaxID=482957 RepID=A0A6P2KGR0_BURL3|nr:hypothetical protein [Burkholderia lata]VWB54665.1 hypothetical protein BLA23254_02500 [Burkholderia lata]
MSFLRRSQWEYQTGSTFGASIEFVMGSGGEILLKNPSGQFQRFWYGGLGVGFGVGVKIPKVRLPKFAIKGKSISGSGSAEAFPSIGWIYMTSAFSGTELDRSDLQGGAVYLDGSAELILAGGSGSVMLLGINPALLSLAISQLTINPMLFEWVIQRAKALLIMMGVNAGLNPGGKGFGGGAGILAGYVH